MSQVTGDRQAVEVQVVEEAQVSTDAAQVAEDEVAEDEVMSKKKCCSFDRCSGCKPVKCKGCAPVKCKGCRPVKCPSRCRCTCSRKSKKCWAIVGIAALVFAVVLAIVILWAVFDLPYLTVEKTEISGIDMSLSEVTLTSTVTMKLTNPGERLLQATLHTMTVDLWSLDKDVNATEGEAIYLGKNTLAEPIEIDTDENQVFDVVNDLVIDAGVLDGSLRARLARDCTDAGAAKKTKLRLGLTEFSGDVAGFDFDVGPSGKKLELEVPCAR